MYRPIAFCSGSPSPFFIITMIMIGMMMISFAEAVPGTTNTGDLTWGQSCSPSATLYNDSSTRCDTSKRLSCDMKLGTCQCHHRDRDIFSGERCETKVGKFCSPSETFPTICVKNAVCDGSTSFCICMEGAEPNEDGTACLKQDDNDEANSATTLNHFCVHFTIIFMLLGGISL